MKRKNHVSVEGLLEASGGSIYKLAMLAAKRSLQIADGDKPLVGNTDDKPLDAALREIEAGRIRIKKKSKTNTSGKK